MLPPCIELSPPPSNLEDAPPPPPPPPCFQHLLETLKFHVFPHIRISLALKSVYRRLSSKKLKSVYCYTMNTPLKCLFHVKKFALSISTNFEIFTNCCTNAIRGNDLRSAVKELMFLVSLKVASFTK